MTTMTLNESDLNFFQDVYNLMITKYPEVKNKFGIWRTHQHFELNQDEIFHETSNMEKKESILKIIKKEDLPENAFASTWKLTEIGPVVTTWCCDDITIKA